MFNPQTILIYSVGLIGGSLGLALKASGYTGCIIGLSSAASIKTALEIGAIDEGHSYADLLKVSERADCVFLCGPVFAIIDTIKKLGTVPLKRGCLITDVGSTKEEIVSAAGIFSTDVQFLGGHPMAGSEKSGVAAADPYLFQNAVYTLTPQSGLPDSMISDFARFLEQFTGCRCMLLDPATHDRVVATVSHVPHMLAVALVNLACNMERHTPGTLRLGAGGFRDMTRIASAKYSLWHDILMTNSKAILPVIDEYVRLLLAMKVQLANGNLQSVFDSASQTRAAMPVRSKGFFSQLYEVLVLAKDQPGSIAGIANVLTNASINIKDIEVVRVREGEGGTIRLGFESQSIACQAIALLANAGFSARERE